MGQWVYGKFQDEKGNYVRVEIRELGGAHDRLEEVTIRSLKVNLNGNPQEPYKPYSTTSGELTISINRDGFWQRRLIRGMLDAGDHGFGIHIYVSNKDDFGPLSKPVHIGFIDINNLSYDDYPMPFDLNLKFYDGLASLRDTEFKSRAAPYEEGGVAWARSVHDMIFDCINCIPNIDLLIKDPSVAAVKVNCRWFATNMDLVNGNLDNPLEVVAVNPFKWNENNADGPIGVFDKAGAVLEELLSRFQLRMYFSGTNYVIEQMSERRNEVVIKHSYRLDGTNFYGVFAPGRGEQNDIELDRELVHRVAKGGFGHFPAAREVRVTYEYTNDFSWINTGDAFNFDSTTDVLNQEVCALISPKYNYDAANQRIAYRLRIRMKSDYLLGYVNYAFAHRYVYSLKFMFSDDLMADRKFNDEYLRDKISWGENRWVSKEDLQNVTVGPIIPSNPLNPDESAWIADYIQELYNKSGWHTHPSQIFGQDDWGEWRDLIIEGYTAPIPDTYKTGNFPVGVCFSMAGLLAYGKGNNLRYGPGVDDFVPVPNYPTVLWWSGFEAPTIFNVQYEVVDFAVFLVDENKEIITDTATRVYSGFISDKNKKVIDIPTGIGDGPGPMSVSALRVLNTEQDWVLPEGWTYSGIPGEHDIHELQVRELMRFYGNPRRMLTGKIWLQKSSETVYGAPFGARFHYDGEYFLPMQASYDFQTNILDGSLISVEGLFDEDVDVEVTEYEGTDARLGMKGGRAERELRSVDPAAGLGVVQLTDKIGIDSDVNSGSTAIVSELKIPEANYGYFNKGDQVQVTDGNTGRRLIFTVEQDVMPGDETIQVEDQEVDIELGENATVMMYQEHFESNAYTDNRRKYYFEGPLAVATDRIHIPDWELPDKSIISTTLIRKRLNIHIGSSKSIYAVPTFMGCDIDNVANDLVFNEEIPAGEYVEVIYDGVRMEK